MPTISISAEPLSATRERTKKDNPFIEHIASFNDGATREVKLSDGERASTVVNHLRAAADTLGRSVSLSFVGELKDAREFRFLLRDKITRAKKTVNGVEVSSSTVDPLKSVDSPPVPAPAKSKGAKK